MVLTAVNQLCVADITYLRLASEFAYFAVVLDAFSRRAIGWPVGRKGCARLIVDQRREQRAVVVAALREAACALGRRRQVQPDGAAAVDHDVPHAAPRRKVANVFAGCAETSSKFIVVLGNSDLTDTV